MPGDLQPQCDASGDATEQELNISDAELPWLYI